mmetsp:Transcript_20540/g.30511  ORF Transcript_20540/g.30511 Transcript_20540/m.30511 type:complete len:121 (+) Transcript_20540:140-502(+)
MSCSRHSDFSSFEEWLALTKHPKENIRYHAIRKGCPCQVKQDIKEIWDRFFEIIEEEKEESDRIRYQILHNLCDGTPKYLEERVIDCLENNYWNDSCKKTRRAARKVLTVYRRTGNWNTM